MALSEAASRLAEAEVPVTAHAMAQAARVPLPKAQQVARDMERAGELERRGSQTAPRRGRPAIVYTPTRLREAASLRLADITRSWACAARAR